MRLDSENYLDVKVIDERTKYWFIRTESGLLYDDYRFEGYISLGWNYISKGKLDALTNTEHHIREILEEEYCEKQPTRIINQCKSFVYEMKKNDYVIFPDAGSSNYTIGKLVEYYEEEISITIEEEKLLMDTMSIQKSENNNQSPYKKRWKIDVLNSVSSSSVNPQLYIALRSPGSMMNIDKYYEYILSLVYPVYIIGNTINITFDVKKAEGISARQLNDFTSSIIGVFDYFSSNDKIEIIQKTSLNSPGSIMLKIENSGLKTVADLTGVAIANKLIGIPGPVLAIGVLIIAITGGEAFGLKFPGIIKAVQDARLKNKEIEKEEIENMHLRSVYSNEDNVADIEAAKILLSKNGYSVEKHSIEALAMGLQRSAEELEVETEKLRKVIKVDFIEDNSKA